MGRQKERENEMRVMISVACCSPHDSPSNCFTHQRAQLVVPGGRAGSRIWRMIFFCKWSRTSVGLLRGCWGAAVLYDHSSHKIQSLKSDLRALVLTVLFTLILLTSLMGLFEKHNLVTRARWLIDFFLSKSDFSVKTILKKKNGKLLFLSNASCMLLCYRSPRPTLWTFIISLFSLEINIKYLKLFTPLTWLKKKS